MCILAAFITRTKLSMMNKRNQKILQERVSRDEGKSAIELEQEDGEVWDNDPRYVFLV